MLKSYKGFNPKLKELDAYENTDVNMNISAEACKLLKCWSRFYMKCDRLIMIHLLACFVIVLVSIIACYKLVFTNGLILYGDFTLPTSLEKFFDMHYPLWDQYGS